MDEFETEHLRAEPLRRAHFGDLCRMHRNRRVMATLGGVRTADETRRFLCENLRHWGDHGYGLWVFRDRHSGSFVGRGGLRRLRIEGRDEVELAYALMDTHWGRGLATEMGRAMLAVGLGRLGLRDIVALALATNRASRRVMEKLGFRFEREFARNEQPHVLYRLHRPE